MSNSEQYKELIRQAIESKNETVFNEALLGTDEKISIRCIFADHPDAHKSAVFFYSNGNYHCSGACGTFRLAEWLERYYGVSAALLANKEKVQRHLGEWEPHYEALSEDLSKRFSLSEEGYDLEVFDSLKIGVRDGAHYSVPVFIGGELYDVRSYYPGQEPKWKSLPNAKAGLIVPFDQWAKTTGPTYVCAGEKDMLIARSKGLNAICVTGGEGTVPKDFGKYFENRECYVLYDNDKAGIEGGAKMANFLFQHKAKVKNVTAFHESLKEHEDVYDFFVKYKKTVEDLDECVERTEFLDSKISGKLNYLSLQALSKENINKFYRTPWTTRVQCRSSDDLQSVVVTKATVRLRNKSDPDDSIEPIEIDYSLDRTPERIIALYNASGTATLHEHDIITKALKIPTKKYDVDIEIKERMQIYMSLVSAYDEVLYTTEATANTALEFPVMSNVHLEASKIYNLSFFLISNPSMHNTTLLSVYDAEDMLNYNSFSLSPKAKEHLRLFQAERDENERVTKKAIDDKIEELFRRMIPHVGSAISKDIWLCFELVFCSPIEYVFENKTFRAAIHATVIGDSQIGKSTTIENMIQLYKHGTKVNAKLATIGGLVGGTDKSSLGKSRTKSGTIALNNRGLIAIEEIHGMGQEYFSKLTEVKSSNIISIDRVSDKKILDAKLRLIEIANPVYGEIATYDNGIKIAQDLIGRKEDIARVDLFGIFSKLDHDADKKHDTSEEPFPSEAYVHRIDWIWSRNAKDIVFTFTKEQLRQSAKRLEERFVLDAPIFMGLNAVHRLLRLACAFAAMLVSTDANFKSVYVTAEHLAYATDYFLNVYSGKYYRFDRASKIYREKNVLTDAEKERLDGDLTLSEFRNTLRMLCNDTVLSINDFRTILEPEQCARFFR